jgi:hypothetical protein
MAVQVVGMATRCMFKLGHNGPHEGKWRKQSPYHRERWFKGDGREFHSDRENEWAWIVREKK